MSRQATIPNLFALGKRTLRSNASPQKPTKRTKKQATPSSPTPRRTTRSSKASPRKPSRTVASSSEEEEEDFTPSEPEEVEEDFVYDAPMSEEEMQEILSPEISPPSTPKKKGRQPAKSKTLASPPRSAPKTPGRNTIATPKSPKSPRVKKAKEEKRFEWLITIRDNQFRVPTDPDYDPRTLHIPESAFQSLSAFESQFWRIKQNYFDTIVFFKKGKFYELYEMDADIGKREFDLKMTDRVNMRMVGVPEASIHQWAAKFLARGYKIAQVDQVESAIAMNRRVKSSGSKGKGSKQDKIIRREVTRILTQGTLLDEEFIGDYKPQYLLSLKEEFSDDATHDHFVDYGVCIVDCSVGRFSLCTLQDDVKRTRLQTLLVQTEPKELLLEKGGVSEKTKQMLNTRLNQPLCNWLPPSEFLSAEAMLPVLQELTQADTPLVVARQSAAAQSALGACLAYLKTLKIDQSLVPRAQFEEYSPYGSPANLAMDGQALLHLEVLHNNVDHRSQGSLFHFMDHCRSKFGQRLLRTWVCSPLMDVPRINERLDCIDWLANHSDFVSVLHETLQVLPDVERSLSRLQSGRNLKVNHLLDVIDSLEKIQCFIEVLHEGTHPLDSSTLPSTLQFLRVDDSLTHTFQASLALILSSFDQDKARREQCIEPRAGVSADYDTAQEHMQGIRQGLEKHLKEQQKLLGVPIKFTHMQKEKYQMEIAQTHVQSIDLPADYQLVSNTKQVKRFYDPYVQQALKQLADAEEDFNVAKEGVFQHALNRFNTHADTWRDMVSRMALLDALASLYITSHKTGGLSMCRPLFVEGATSTHFEIEGMRHPMLSTKNPDFIANSLALGGAQPARVVLLTGPNMGGKSTLLRQLCLLVVMAQVGCYVPATSCRLAPVDRIFTRLGASDDILMGQSTFMVELQETSTILQHATDRSLIILDELGRGTSTFDGYSIAYATLDYLARRTKASILFSTHYHALTEEFQNNPCVSLQHMACHVDEDDREVVFLYQLQEGVCPRSYGMNVALAAGLPRAIVDRADAIAAHFEARTRQPVIQLPSEE